MIDQIDSTAAEILYQAIIEINKTAVEIIAVRSSGTSVFIVIE